MSAISRISTNTPWEPIVGYSRLVRAGDVVAVSGTTATDERGLIVGPGQMYVQARQALSNIRTALERAGLGMHQVIRTRMFVTDIARFEEAARAHKEFFADSPPATSMVEVQRLVNPDMLIEIEADAYAGVANATGASAKPRGPGKPKAAKKPAKKIVSKKKPARRK
jgi:enamine deaminase RidA (YjgF/YER057c/UK114 family)